MISTYNTDNQTNQLYNIHNSNIIQTAKSGIKNGNQSYQNDQETHMISYHHSESFSQRPKHGCHPQDFTDEGGDEENTTHEFSISLLHWINHGDVTRFANLFGENETACKKKDI